MSAKYKVSVIIPIYNVAEYLEECLESMVRQTIDSLEVIMVDDRLYGYQWSDCSGICKEL